MVEVYIGIGSNLDNPKQQVKWAIDALKILPESIFESVSSIYTSKPQGPEDQPDFFNAVAKISTDLSPDDLLRALQQVEVDQGKIKKRHWGERVIDLDILLYGDIKLNTERLVIPHPEIRNRDFVLLPLQELTSQVPLLGKVADLISVLNETYVYPVDSLETDL